MRTKKYLLFTLTLFFIGVSNIAAQTKVEVLPKDKKPTRVEPLPAETATQIPLLTDEPDHNDLLDIHFPKENRPKTPNAGLNAQDEPNLLGIFYFDRKITYSINATEGSIVSHFFFDTKSGTSYKDPKALQDMMDEKMEEEMHQIFTSNGVFYQYMNSKEMGKVATKLDMTQGDYLLMDLKTLEGSTEFFKNFKPTGVKKSRDQRNNIPPSIEYAGFIDGKKYYVYLADPGDIMLHTGFTYNLTGYAGLGYIATPSKRTYMIVGFYAAGAGIYMVRMEKVNKTFSAKEYKPMGNLMPDIGGATAGMHQFAQNNNLKDLTQTETSGMPSSNDLFDLAIQGLEQGVRDIDRQINEAQRQNNLKVVNNLKCNRECNVRQLNIYKEIKSEYQTLSTRYKNDEEKRDEEFGKLMERKMSNITPCNCN